jgi:hypothetical protein
MGCVILLRCLTRQSVHRLVLGSHIFLQRVQIPLEKIVLQRILKKIYILLPLEYLTFISFLLLINEERERLVLLMEILMLYMRRFTIHLLPDERNFGRVEQFFIGVEVAKCMVLFVYIKGTDILLLSLLHLYPFLSREIF